jgi:SAM-dependent methyltransferase
VLGFYSKYDRVFRKFMPSLAVLSYNPLYKTARDVIAKILAWPFEELRDLPPNHLRLRVGTGNQLFANHFTFIHSGNHCLIKFLSRKYCTSKSDVVELGCGCGRIALAFRDPQWDPWFEGTYVGIDIDREMLEYCRAHFPGSQFQFILSPHRSSTYSSGSLHSEQEVPSKLAIADEQSKDFVYSLSLYSHLLETEFIEYMQESYRILRTDGVMFMTFFCIEHVELGGRWAFGHQCGNAYIESVKYPEAAVAYREAFVIDLAKKCGFREVTISPKKGQSELVARK